MKQLLLYLFLFNAAIGQDSIKPGTNLITEGMPAIPATVIERIKPYTEARSAGLAGWHPKDRRILITTRFGNVFQVHEVNMPMGARKQLTFYDDPVTNASYEPVNGKYFIFTRDTGGDEFSQLYRYDLGSGNVTLLTDGKRSQNIGISWSHDGKKIAYASTRRNGADRDIYIMDSTDKSTDRMLVQLAGGGWTVMDWSPDNKFLLVAETISANESHYHLVNVITGEKKELTNRTDKNVSNRHAVFSKNGKGIYFVTDRDNEFARLAYMDLNSKKITYLTSGINWEIEGFDQSEDGKHIAFSANENGFSRLYLLHISTNKYKPLRNIPDGVLAQLQAGEIALHFHRNNTDLAFSISSARTPFDIFSINITTNKVERWTESEMGGIVASSLRNPELIKWRSFDNKEISGFYYKPASNFKGKRPVIINIHGGPENQSRPFFLGVQNYYLNELGVAVIFPNVRGSAGYGKTFLTADNGLKRLESVKDIGALLDWIKTQPDLDPERIMVTGQSYGGYMTLAVATMYNERIRASLNIVGVSNFNTFLKNTESYRRDLRRAEYGDERVPEIADFFEKIAPLNNAHKITKPMFIVQGANDPRVPRTESIQMAEKIRANGGNVWYLEAKDEGHGFRKKNNLDFLRYATVQFIQMYLLDGMEEGRRF